MTSFYDIAEFTGLRKLNNGFYHAQDINTILDVLFTFYGDVLRRIQEAYAFIDLSTPSVTEADYFKDIVEFFNLLLTNSDIELIAFSNLFNAFVNIGTYDGFTYAVRAFLGDDAIVNYTFTTLDLGSPPTATEIHSKLSISVSNFGTPFTDNLVTNDGDNLVTNDGDNLVTNSQYFFEGNPGLVRVLLDSFVPAGLVYDLEFITVREGRNKKT